MLLTCEYYGYHRCTNCLKISKAVYKAISGRVDLPWLCRNSITKSLESVKTTKTIEDRCNDFVSEFQQSVEERMVSIENQVRGVKFSLTSMKTDIVEKVKKAVAITPSTVSSFSEVVEAQQGKTVPLNTDSIVQKRLRNAVQI